MSKGPRAFIALDRGTATTAVALVGRVHGSWRLLGATAAPSIVDPDAVVERMLRRFAAGEPELAEVLRLSDPDAAVDLPRVACATTRPPEIAVVAATARVLGPLAAAAASAGWRVRPLVLDGVEILPVATALADRRVSAILAGASDPPGADERGLLPDLETLVAAATERRPDLVTVLAGGLAAPGGRIEALFRPDRPGPTVLGPSPTVGGGEPLRELLDSLRGGDHDGRRALATATVTLAEVLRRRVEVVEIGQTGASRAVARLRRREARAGALGVRPGRRPACRPASATRTSMPSPAGSRSRWTGCACVTACASWRSCPGGTHPARARCSAWLPSAPRSDGSWMRPRA